MKKIISASLTSQTYYARVSSFYTLLMLRASLPRYLMIGLMIEKTNVITVGYLIGIYINLNYINPIKYLLG